MLVKHKTLALIQIKAKKTIKHLIVRIFIIWKKIVFAKHQQLKLLKFYIILICKLIHPELRAHNIYFSSKLKNNGHPIDDRCFLDFISIGGIEVNFFC